MKIEKNKKTNVTIKQAFIEFNKLVDAETGEQLDIAEIVSKVYGPEQEVKITITASTTEEVDYESIESEDSDAE